MRQRLALELTGWGLTKTARVDATTAAIFQRLSTLKPLPMINPSTSHYLRTQDNGQ